MHRHLHPTLINSVHNQHTHITIIHTETHAFLHPSITSGSRSLQQRDQGRFSADLWVNFELILSENKSYNQVCMFINNTSTFCIPNRKLSLNILTMHTANSIKSDYATFLLPLGMLCCLFSIHLCEHNSIDWRDSARALCQRLFLIDRPSFSNEIDSLTLPEQNLIHWQSKQLLTKLTTGRYCRLLPLSPGLTVKNLAAVHLLQSSLLRSHDAALCCQLLRTFRTIWEEDPANFFLLEWTIQSTSQLAACVWRKPAPVQKLFFSMLEMVWLCLSPLCVLFCQIEQAFEVWLNCFPTGDF